MAGDEGVCLAAEPKIWYVLGSIKSGVRRAYDVARVRKEPQAVCFVPLVKRVIDPVDKLWVVGYYLTIRGYDYSYLTNKAADKSGSGLGNMMIYRVCDVKPPGWLAKAGGSRGLEEAKLLSDLQALGWDKTYKWMEFDSLLPDRVVY